jgi:septal ring factor EnvC (AmiA/AmiB activator)
MVEITDTSLTNNPVVALLLLVGVCFMWHIVGILFSKLTKVNDKANDAFVRQLQEVVSKLTEISFDLRVAIEKISNHDKDIINIDNEIKELDSTSQEHSKTLALHEVRITTLERKNN